MPGRRADGHAVGRKNYLSAKAIRTLLAETGWHITHIETIGSWLRPDGRHELFVCT
jgi:hypothetical protein